MLASILHLATQEVVWLCVQGCPGTLQMPLHCRQEAPAVSHRLWVGGAAGALGGKAAYGEMWVSQLCQVGHFAGRMSRSFTG